MCPAPRPCLHRALNHGAAPHEIIEPKFFEKLAIGTAWQAQKEQPFGKDNL
jgi:hypothetical protein